MSYKLNPFTGKFDYYEKSKTSYGRLSPYTIAFFEEFVGDGADVTFNLTGAVVNGTFSKGSWDNNRVVYVLPLYVRDDNDDVLYDSPIPIIRNEITISSIDPATGEITLSHPPMLLDTFRIWYWYELNTTDQLSFYYRTDFVEVMEADASSSIALNASNVIVNTTLFNHILGPSDTDVQKALETIDEHTHPGPAVGSDRIEIEGLYKIAYNGKYSEFVFTGEKLTQINIFDSDLKVTKLFTKTISYDLADNIDTVTIVDEVNGNTLTKHFTYDINGNIESKDENFL